MNIHLTKEEETIIFHAIILEQVRIRVEGDQHSFKDHSLGEHMEMLFVSLNQIVSKTINQNKREMLEKSLRYIYVGDDSEQFTSYRVFFRGYETDLNFFIPHLDKLIERTYRKLFKQHVLDVVDDHVQKKSP